MNRLWKVFVSMSLSGSLLILLLLACRPVWKDRLSRQWQYYIWLAVIARLLLPLSPEVSLMGTLFQREEAEPAPVVLVVPETETAEFLPVDVPPQAESEPSWRLELWAVWLAAAALLLIRKITLYQGFSRYIRAGCTEVSDIALLDRLAELCGQCGVRRPVELYENSLASSPMLLGFFKPCVILPDSSLPDADFEYTLRHELTHYRRRDLLYKWLVQLTVCLHWFNPLVWLMAREVNRDCELACDEAVMQALDSRERRAYGDMLLRAAASGGRYHGPAGSIPLHESGKLLKERLDAIMNFKKRSKLVTVFSCLLAAVLLMGAAMSGAYMPPNSVKGDPDAAYRYTQEGYYQAPYLFEIGWNVQKKAERMYYNTPVTLSDGSTMTVLLAGSCKDSLKDKNILSALTAVLSRLKEESAETEFPLTRPLLLSVKNTGAASAAALAERCYQDEDIAGYAAAFALLDEDVRRVYLNRCYADGRIAFWGASWTLIAADSPLVKEFAEKTYQDGSLSFYSVVANASGTDWTRQGLEEMKTEREKQQAEEYKKYGIIKDGMDYYYQGKLARIFVDFSADESFVTLQTNPNGMVDVKVTRNTDSSIKSVGYLTKSEREDLFGDDWEDDDLEKISSGIPNAIPVNLKSLKKGEIIRLGEYDLDYGDQILFDISAEKGGGMQVAFSKPGDDSLNTVYYSVENKQQGTTGPRCTANAAFAPPVKPGRYSLFLRATDGDLTNISGGYAVNAGPDEDVSAVNISIDDLLEADPNILDSCKDQTWYLLHSGGRQYIYYNGFNWSFGYMPELAGGKWTVDIVRFQKKDGGCVLLALPEGAPVSVTCDGEAVTLSEIK